MRIPLSFLLAPFLLVAACGDAAPPPPPPWLPLAVGPQTTVSVDTSRIEDADANAKLWIRFDFRPPHRFAGTPVSRLDTQDRLDCAQGMVINLWMRQWDPQGKPVMDEAATGRWRTMRDHPLGETVYPRVCEWLAEQAQR